MKILNFIYTFPLSLKLPILLVKKEYTKIDKFSDKIYKNKYKEFIKLYFLFNSKLQQNEMEKAKYYFWFLKNKYGIDKGVVYDYMKGIIKNYIEVKDCNKSLKAKEECEKLLTLYDDKELKVYILKVLCTAAYYCWEFGEVRKYCKELNAIGDDNDTDYVRGYLKAIELEENK